MRPRVVALRPYSPKLTRLPTSARPRLRPFCCLRNLVRLGCSISTKSLCRWAPSIGSLLGYLGFQVEDFAFEDPNLHSDNAIRGVRLGKTIINLRAQRM